MILFILVLVSCNNNPIEPVQEVDDPYNLQIEFIDDDVVELSWESNANNNTYIISRSVGEFGWDSEYREFDEETTSLLDTIPTQSFIIHSYYLKEVSEDTVIGVSDTVAWISNDVFPTNFIVEHIKQDSIKLTWQDNSIGELAYRIDRKIGNNIWEENHLLYIPNPNNGYGSLENCVDYIETVEDTIFYRICILNGKSRSIYNETSIFTNMLPPDNLVATLEENNIRLNWIENCQIETGFIIERKSHGEEYGVIDFVGANITTWLDNNLDPSHIYYYRVKMFSDVFSSDYSNTAIGNVDHQGYWVPFDYPTIQDAIDVLYYSEEVVILPGIYHENIQINDKYPNINSFYSLTGEEQYIEQTVIDGGQNGSVFSFVNCDSDIPSINGLTLQNGSGNYTNTSNGSSYHYCGGGILLEHSNLNIYNLDIKDNTTEYGGGIACVQNSNCYINNTEINENRAYIIGAGIYCNESVLTILESSINNNFTPSNGSGMYCINSTINISDSNISSNNSCSCGGGFYIKFCSIVLENLMICNNTADYGGGIYLYGSNFIMRNLIINGNEAFEGGGVKFGNVDEHIFENILLTNNTADFGAAIFVSGADTNITNVTFYENEANSGGGAIYGRHHSDTVIMNSIFWNNSPQEIMIRPGNMPSSEGSVTIRYSDIEGGLENISSLDPNSINWLEGNLAIDPLFLNPGIDDFHLQTNSPCIDAGNPNREYCDTDGTRNDMGTYGGPNAGSFINYPYAKN